VKPREIKRLAPRKYTVRGKGLYALVPRI